MSKWRKFNITTVILILITFWGPQLVQGQNTPSPLLVDSLQISIWPEYDAPGVLVVYSGTIVNQLPITYTGPIAFNVPKEVADMEMVCESEAGLHCVIYQITSMEKYKQVSWQATRPIQPGEGLPFLLEFYYNPLSAGTYKELTYTLYPTYQVDNLTWDVKQPFDSEDFWTEPTMEEMGPDVNGFNTYRLKQNKVVGEEQLTISYQRESELPSIDRTMVITASPGYTIEVNQDQDPNKQMRLILIGSFLALVGYFGYKSWRWNK